MEINPKTLNKVLRNYKREIIDGYLLVEDEITSSDPEDGGADHDAIIKHVETNKFYLTRYSDWDMMNDAILSESFNTDLREVFPVTKTVTVYETR